MIPKCIGNIARIRKKIVKDTCNQYNYRLRCIGNIAWIRKKIVKDTCLKKSGYGSDNKERQFNNQNNIAMRGFFWFL